MNLLIFYIFLTASCVIIDTELYMKITLPEYFSSSASLIGNDFLTIQTPEYLSKKECYELLKTQGKNYNNYQFTGHVYPFAIFNYNGIYINGSNYTIFFYLYGQHT